EDAHLASVRRDHVSLSRQHQSGRDPRFLLHSIVTPKPTVLSYRTSRPVGFNSCSRPPMAPRSAGTPARRTRPRRAVILARRRDRRPEIYRVGLRRRDGVERRDPVRRGRAVEQRGADRYVADPDRALAYGVSPPL